MVLCFTNVDIVWVWIIVYYEQLLFSIFSIGITHVSFKHFQLNDGQVVIRFIQYK